MSFLLALACLLPLVALAALPPLAPGASPDDGFQLRLFQADSPAKCLDGSPGGYYIRKGVGANASVWLIELEGGGWCSSYDDCLSRSTTDIGSSKAWPPQGCPSMDGGSNGIFSRNCTVNPVFCNASAVHMNYADGASFAGHRDAPINVSGKLIYFRGRDILDATLDALLHVEGMASATVVVLKGCSAGGLATILHEDYVAEVVNAAVPSAVVLALPDAGYFLDHNNTLGHPTWTPLYQWVSQAQNVTPSVDAGCVAHYPPDEAWKCFMAQYTAPYLSTPTFFAQDLDDSWQMQNIYQLPCSPFAGKGNCNATELALVDAYYTDTLAALAPVFANPIHGGFFTACVQHCHSNINVCFNDEIVQGQSMSQTFTAWYDKTVSRGAVVHEGVATTVIDSRGLSNPTCTSSCSPY